MAGLRGQRRYMVTIAYMIKEGEGGVNQSPLLLCVTELTPIPRSLHSWQGRGKKQTNSQNGGKSRELKGVDDLVAERRYARL